MNVVLIGYRCAGKSTVGKQLADRLHRGFVDIDDVIEERFGAPINDIVKSHGWDHFRAMEKRVVEGVANQDHLIIASGGGSVLDTENVMALGRNGLIIWLKADCEVLRQRMERDPDTVSRRPNLTRKGALEEFEEVMTYRNPFYEQAAEVQLDTSGLEVEAVVEVVFSILQKRGYRV